MARMAEALAGARFALFAAKVVNRTEMKTIQKELEDLHSSMEDAVDRLMGEVEQFTDSENLPIIYSSTHTSSARLREESTVTSRFGKVVMDMVSSIRGKVTMTSKLSEVLSDTLSHFKQQCDDLSHKVETLTSEFAQITEELNIAESEKRTETLKECRSCKRYLTKIEDFGQEIVQLRDELTKTEGILSEKQIEREQLVKEVGNLASRNRELEKELRKVQNSRTSPIAGLETLDLQRELKRSEMTIAELESQLKSTREAADAMKSSFLESQSELEPCESALRKAQSLIKKLNSESEKLTEQLHETERLSELFKRDAHQYEKSYRDAQIQLQAIDVMQVTEGRLREEVQALKDALANLKAESAEEIARLKDYINQLIKENQGFQTQTVELETSIVELDKEVKERDSIIAQQNSQLSDLQTTLSQRTAEVQQLLRESDQREEEFEAELAHIKRVAENTIRSAQQVPESEEHRGRSKSPINAGMMPLKKSAGVKRTAAASQLNTTAPKPVEEKKEEHEPPTGEYYKGQLEEALYRENCMKSALQAILSRSGSFLRERVRNLELLETAMRPETERWMMRCEELETSVQLLGGRLVRTLGLMRDLQKMILVKERQMEEMKKTSSLMERSHQSFLDSLSSDSTAQSELILTELLPKSHNLLARFSDSLLRNSGSTKLLEDRLQELRHDLAAKQDKSDQLARELDRTEETLESARRELARREADFEGVKKAIAGEQSETSSVASGSEMKRVDLFESARETPVSLSTDAEDVVRSIRTLHQSLNSKSQDLDRLESKFRELIASNKELQQVFEEDKESMSQEIQTLADRCTQLETEAREVAGKLRSEKSQRELAEAEKGRLDSLLSDTRTRLSASDTSKDSLQRRCDECTATIQRLETEVHSLREANDQLLSDLRSAHSDVSALLEFKSRAEEQTVKIERLQDQLSALGVRGSVALSARETEDLSMTRSRGRSQTRSDVAGFMSVDRLLSQKDDYIKELESRLQSTAFDETTNCDTDRLKRMKSKVAGYKRSFNKRLEEFESVLHLIEDAVTAASSGEEARAEWRPSENESLDTWTQSLLGKIDEVAEKLRRASDRERKTYLGALTILHSGEVAQEEKLSAGSLISALQKQMSPDLDFVSTQLLHLLKRVVPTSHDARKAVARSYTAEDVVHITAFHARLLVGAVTSLDNVEISLIERKESLLQVADELTVLTRSLAETSVRNQAEVAGKMADMFSKFSVQFLQDLKRDLQELGEALRDLREVTRSNPSVKGQSLSTFAQTSPFRRP